MKQLLVMTLFLSLPLWAQNSEWPTELITIEKVSYPRNSRASFCIRPLEMVDTIVLHHSETPPTATPMYINRLHLNRGSSSDPWYMIAYSYVINAPYPRYSIPKPVVTEGRPLDIVGAHAGSSAFVSMDQEQQRMWNEDKIVCGKEGGRFQVDPDQIRNGRIKANVTTIGVVIVGNYAPFSRDNPNGYKPSKPVFPTDSTQEMIARLSCQLQKKYPRMKYIKWHNYYHPTTCPGNIKQYVARIRDLAKGFGCDFN